jgi:hypothetical protein
VVNNATGSGAIRARGYDSSNTLAANTGATVTAGKVVIGSDSLYTAGLSSNAEIAGRKNVVALSKITTIANANPDANGSLVPTGVSDIGQFKISAAANSNDLNGLNKVTLSGVIFNIDSTNVVVSSFKLYNKANSNALADCTAKNAANATLASASGSYFVTCSGLYATTGTNTVNTQIEQGSDATFVLQGSVSKVSGHTSYALQVSLQNFDSITRTTFTPATSHFNWVDKDTGTIATDGSTTSSEFMWVDYPSTTVKSTSYYQS